MANRIPVYLFVGFLEGGKTHMIQESMEDERFNSGEKTLLISCESGIEEYDPTRFWGKNVYFAEIENEEDLTEKKLTELSKKHLIDRIIIEYNGMWQLSTLFENMPDTWGIYQCVALADCSTFEVYNANMRSLTVDKLSACEMIVFNRASKNVDKESFHKIVRGVNTRAEIVYDYPDGRIEYDDIEDELPFDVDAPIIEIDDRDYAIWYRDLGEDTDKYEGKTVKFKALVARDENLGKTSLVVGRHVMVCCADDISYSGLVCHMSAETSLKTGDWILLTAKIRIEDHPMYPRRGPVLYAVSTDFAVAPNPELAMFY